MKWWAEAGSGSAAIAAAPAILKALISFGFSKRAAYLPTI
jgi:hypothetical protein